MIGVSIIIPVVRTEKVKSCIAEIHKNARLSYERYEVIVEEDKEGIGCPKMVSMLTKQTNHDWVMFLGDDTLPQESFIVNAIEKIKELPGEWGMVGLNDGVHGDTFSTHWMCHKKMLDLTGGDFFHTGYQHQYCDKELTDIAKEHGRFVFAEDSMIKHDHPFFNGEEPDEHYQRVYAKEIKTADRDLYLKRREERTGQKYKIALTFPVTDNDVSFQFMVSILQLDKMNAELIFPKFGFHKGDIAKVRNDLISEAMRLDCTHIVFLDTDQVYYDADLLHRLLSHDKDIVGGMVCRRYPPFEPILQRGGLHVPDEEIGGGGLVPVDGTGAGCLAVKMSVFEKMEWPWFEVIRDERQEVISGEDVTFCRKAKKLGLELFVDCGVKIGHLATLQVDQNIYQIWKKMRGEP